MKLDVVWYLFGLALFIFIYIMIMVNYERKCEYLKLEKR